MAIELDGNLMMQGDTSAGLLVKIHAGDGRLRILAGDEIIGDWLVSGIGVKSLQDGFSVRAEGDEFVLHTTDDVRFAEELGITAVSPRLGRQLAVRHNPQTELAAELPLISTHVAAMGFGVAGALVVLGGTFLNGTDESDTTLLTRQDGFELWLAFVLGGALMIAAAVVMAIGGRWARLIGTLAILAVVVLFGLAISQSSGESSQIAAFGFIAGGVVVGFAVLVSGSLGQPD